LRSAGVLLAFWSHFGVLAFSFWRSAPWRSGLAFCRALAFWVWRSGALAFCFWRSGCQISWIWAGLAFWRSGVLVFGVLPPLAFCSGVLPGVLGAGVLLAFWRSAGVLPGVLALSYKGKG